MIITDNRKKNLTAFKSIKAGECFLDEKDELFLKITNLDDINAVSLIDGEPCYFFDGTDVCKVIGEIIFY